MTRHLIETSISLIKNKIQADISAALSDVYSIHPDDLVTLEKPSTESYFNYPSARGYKLPAIFIIGEEIDFQKQQMGANHINAIDRINVACLVEDQDRNAVTLKAYRYQAALHQVLDQVRLTSADNAVVLTVVVMNARFSPLYTQAKDESSVQAVWIKEVHLACDVHHFESM